MAPHLNAVAAPVAEAPKAKRERTNPKDYTYIVLMGGRAVKAFLKDEAAVKDLIAKTDVGKQGKIAIFKYVPLKVQTQTTLG
jgi:hypothetical protein